MLNLRRCFRSLLVVASLTAPVVITGCTARVGVGYRIHDPYYGDYHYWDDHERDYYVQWAREHHRDEHRDYRELNHHDQREYWEWRHHHEDRH